jgi:hypothetical protein
MASPNPKIFLEALRIPLGDGLAFLAIKHTNGERHVLPMTARATGLRGVGRIDTDHLSAGFFRGH